MRLVAVGLLLLASAGCKTVHLRGARNGDACAPTAAPAAAGREQFAQDIVAEEHVVAGPAGARGTIVHNHHYHYPPGQQPCPPGQKGCEKPGEKQPCEKEKPREAPAPEQPRPGPPPEQPSPKEAIVTQDIMLIPRMVYVPYAPQVPVAPARLGHVVPGATMTQRDICPPCPPCPTAPREGPPPAQPAQPREAPCPPGVDRRLLDTLDRTGQIMQQMEQRLAALEARTAAPAPVYAEPCPAPPASRFRQHGILRAPSLLRPDCEPSN
jgi:hypothetical protein